MKSCRNGQCWAQTKQKVVWAYWNRAIENKGYINSSTGYFQPQMKSDNIACGGMTVRCGITEMAMKMFGFGQIVGFYKTDYLLTGLPELRRALCQWANARKSLLLMK
jgi:hypothetical protein